MRKHDKEIIIVDFAQDIAWTEKFTQAMKENKILRILPLFKEDAFYLEAEKRIMLDEPIIVFSLKDAQEHTTIVSLHAKNFNKLAPISYFTALTSLGWEYGDESFLDPKFNELF